MTDKIDGRRRVIAGCPYEHWVSTGKIVDGEPCSEHCAHWLKSHSRMPFDMRPCAECRRIATQEKT